MPLDCYQLDLFFFFTSTFFNRKNFSFKKKDIPALVGLIIFVFFMDVFRFVGLQFVPGSYAALLATLSPFLAAFFSYYIYQEKITLKKLGAIMLGVIAVVPIIIQNLQNCTDCSQWQLCIGYGALFISTVGVVVRSYFLKNLVDIKGYAIPMILGMTFVSAGAVSFLISILTETWNPIPIQSISKILPFIFFIMIFYNLLAQSLFAYLVKKYPITLITFFMLSTPLITAFFYWIFYGVNVNTLFIFSCILLTAAFVLFSYACVQHKN